MELWHFSWSSEDRFPLFPDEARQRAFVRHLARKVGDRIALLGTADDHAHVVAVASAEERHRLSRRLTMALQAFAEPKLAPVFVTPVENRKHLIRLVGYLHGQPRHHGLDTHPAAWSGSTFSDLVGARVLPGLLHRLWDALPRFRKEDVGRGIGAEPEDWSPASDALLAGGGAGALVSAAATAACADPSLSGNAAEVVRARVVAAHLGRAAGLGNPELAAALGVDPRSVRKLRKRQVDSRLLGATRRMWTLQDRFREPCGVQAGLRTTEPRGTNGRLERETAAPCSPAPR